MNIHCIECGFTKRDTHRSAEIMAEEGFPVADPICCEVEDSRFSDLSIAARTIGANWGDVR